MINPSSGKRMNFGKAAHKPKTFSDRYRWTNEEKLQALQELQLDPTISIPEPPRSISYEDYRQTAQLDQRFGKMGEYSTGFKSLDKLCMGFWPGDYCILGAGTNQGKTQLALYVAIHQARQGIPVLYISRELDADEMTRRVQHLTTEPLPNLHFPESHRLKAEEIAGVVIQWQADHIKEDGKGFVVVDHIHAFCRGANLTEALGQISESLRELAQDTKLPILALSQLNRDKYSDEEGPSNYNLKESGYLEDDAYTILMAWRTPHTFHIKLTKSRNKDMGDLAPEDKVIQLHTLAGKLSEGSGPKVQEIIL